MSAHDKKMVRGGGGDLNDSNLHMPHLPSLSSGESEIPPHFQHAVENLSDSDDTSSKSQSDDDSYKTCASNSGASLCESGYFGSSSSVTSEDITYSKKSKKRNAASDHGENEKVKKKKRKLENGDAPKPVISSFAQKMMEKMGFQKGSGLGKYGQGRTAPVEASKQKGRRGLGAIINDVDRSLITYDPAKEVREVHEVVTWLDGREEIEYSTEDMFRSWLKVGAKKRILDDETHFCDPNILKLVLICKSAFDKMSGEEMRRARNRSNPYEVIKKGPYLNRAAMKMANMDSIFHEMFTKPVNEYGDPMVTGDELLYFADVCAGPGGFSEYILSRKKWRAKGFGFTLKGDNDFKLADFYAGPCESFEPYYGTFDDGDVYKCENIISFSNYVHEHTAARGVHFMMADGGFSVEGSENIQEILSKRIYLCQFLVALSIVRTSGHFVCKLFDVFTPFSAGLVYILYRCFKRISIHKPNTSRPANSERYIVCKWKLDNVDHVRDYLLNVNKEFDKYGDANDLDINEIVPLDVLKNDQKFYDYLFHSNNSLGERQINSLAKVLEYSEDETLVEEKQQQLKKECMEAWKVEIKARSGPSNTNPDALSRSLLKNDSTCLRNTPSNIHNIPQVGEFMKSIHDWNAVILGADSRSGTPATFFLGVGHKRCFKYDRSSKQWSPIQDPHWDLELSPNTLVFGEIVSEATYQSRKQMRKNVFHIIDGHTLGDEYIGDRHYSERIRLCALYAKALNRPSMNTLMSIRMKDMYEIDELEDKSFCLMKQVTMKNMTEELAVPLNSSESESREEFYIPRGIMFLKATKSPYIRWISQQYKTKYYWFPDPKVDPKFDQDRPKEASNDFKETYAGSKVWFVNKDEDQNQFNAQRFVVELVHFIRDNKFKKRCT